MKITVNSILFHAAHMMHDKKEYRPYLRGVTFAPCQTKHGVVMVSGNGQAMLSIYDPSGKIENSLGEPFQKNSVFRSELVQSVKGVEFFKAAKIAATENTKVIIQGNKGTLTLSNGGFREADFLTVAEPVNVYRRVMDWPIPEHWSKEAAFCSSTEVEKFLKVAKVLTENKVGPLAFSHVKYGQTLVTFRNYPNAFGTIVSFRGDINDKQPDWW